MSVKFAQMVIWLHRLSMVMNRWCVYPNFSVQMYNLYIYILYIYIYICAHSLKPSKGNTTNAWVVNEPWITLLLLHLSWDSLTLQITPLKTNMTFGKSPFSIGNTSSFMVVFQPVTLVFRGYWSRTAMLTVIYNLPETYPGPSIHQLEHVVACHLCPKVSKQSVKNCMDISVRVNGHVHAIHQLWNSCCYNWLLWKKNM